MNPTATDIDRIVSQVLAELRAGGTAAANGKPAASRVPAATIAPAAAAKDVRRIAVADRVVTLAAIEGRLNGATVVTVRRDAVVTPSVRDELKARNIHLEYADGAQGVASASLPLIVGLADLADDPGALMKTLPNHVTGMARVEWLHDRHLPALVRKIGQAVAAQEALGLVLSSRPAAAAGLANRLAGVRAAWACSLTAVREAVATFAPNVIAYNPRQHATFEQRAMLREYIRHGVQPCPAEWEDS